MNIEFNILLLLFYLINNSSYDYLKKEIINERFATLNQIIEFNAFKFFYSYAFDFY
jgi:hypothetical protein